MNAKFLYRITFVLLSLLVTGCNDDKEIFFEDMDLSETLDRIHSNERDKPYPREEHELFLNPSPLIVPEAARGEEEFLEFELSQSADFPDQGTYRSGKLAWNMYNIHEEMAAGEWYWRFRKVGKEGNAAPWSITYKFTVSGKEETFVAPAFSAFQQNIPTTYPRVHCYLDEEIKKIRPNIAGHREYSDLIGRAKRAMDYPIQTVDPYDKDRIDAVNEYVFDYLYTAYLLTGEQRYYDKMLEYGRRFLAYQIPDSQLFSENFYSAAVVNIFSTIYDACQESLTVDEKAKMETMMSRIVVFYYNMYRGYQENYLFDNHTWQIVLRAMLQGSFVICQEYPEAMTALEYFYELWVARAPASGFNRDGNWYNGTGYIETNSYTLQYMPMLFSHLAKTDFLQHPWYKNAGKAVAYFGLPGSYTPSFGDKTEYYLGGNRIWVAFADFLARETGDSYAAWYVKECGNLNTNYNFRLYRIARDYITYSGQELQNEDIENFIWHKDSGEGIAIAGVIDSNNNNMTLAFRSSPFGSGSHTLSDQNGFKLLYKGQYVYMSAGYYQEYGDKHDLLQHRHTRGQNSILVNGIGQPFSTRGYGNINRALNGKNIAYFMGDASHAYSGISEDPTWTKAFERTGLAQTPEYGFGKTPLNNYKRHIFLLRPNKVVIYDDLGADEAVTWQWLLHSPVEFRVSGNKIVTNYPDKGGFTSVAQMYSKQIPIIKATKEWTPGGAPADQDPIKYPKQGHLTAEFGSSAHNKILTIIQLSDDGQVEDVWEINNNSYLVGDWNIKAELSATAPAAISIVNKATGVAFSYGYDASATDGTPYQRQQENSSVLYDYVGGTMQVQEIVDWAPQSTRSIK